MMKILVLSDLYPPHYIGGHEIRCKEIADQLRKRGHEVFILTSKYGAKKRGQEGNTFRSLYYLDSDIDNIFSRRCEQIKKAFYGRSNYLITRKIIKDIQPDIVYSGQLKGISTFPMKAIQKQKIPIVHHLGNYFFEELVRDCVLEPNALKRFLRRIVNGFNGLEGFDFNHIIAVSEAVKKTYQKVGFSESSITVIPPKGINSETIKVKRRESTPISKKEIKLLYAGRILKTKGVHIAIKSIEYLINCLNIRNITFDIMGDGDQKYIEDLKALVDKLAIHKHVKFKGELLHRELIESYKNYDILLVPSIWEEPFGNVLLEAMSQGVPVVASNTGGIVDIIKNGWNGLLVPKEDPKKLAEAIKTLIDDPILYEQICINEVKEIKEKYTMEKIMDRIENYLKDVLN